MAKDDYDVVVYKILLYLYACMKRTISFDQDVYNATIEKDKISPEYLTDIYRMMQTEGLIEGVVYIKAWGRDKIMISKEKDISITATGIRYLKENGSMNKVKEFLLDNVGMVANLITILHL